MLRRLCPLLLLCAAALLPAAPRAAIAPEPPLPGDEARPAGQRKPFELVPKRDTPTPEGELPEDPPEEIPGEIPADSPPIFEDPIQPAPGSDPLEQLQDIEAPGAPSDGEPLPEMPYVPGLVMPKFRPAPLPGSRPPGTAPDTSPLPDLLPAPELALARKTRWIRSPFEACRTARGEGKPVLIFFAQLLNGAGPTANLNDDLLSLPEFNEFASTHLVCTKLQYPTSRSPGGSFTQEKLDVLELVQKKYKIRGFPVLILLDEKGHEIERISGYSRVKDPATNVIYSKAHSLLDRLKEAEKRFSERRQYNQQRVDRLTAQGYRTWYSTKGTSLLAKLVSAGKDEVTLMDENGAWRGVYPGDLRLYDAEWARRKQAGLLPSPGSAKETAAAAGVPIP